MRAPYLDDGDVRLYLGDCIEVMREMDADSVDAVVCDPPYGIGFMGKAWDAAAITERVERDNASRATLGPDSPSRPGRKKPRSSSAYGNRAIAAGPVRDHTLTRARSGSMHAGEYDLSLTANAAFAAWCETWAREALRVLKPGGHLLAFGGTRTFHRLTVGIEDAGFEVRDCLSWLYGSGFPKSLDVSKAIDKKRHDADDVRVVCRWLRERMERAGMSAAEVAAHFEFHPRMVEHWAARDTDSQPSLPTLQQWDGLRGLLGFGDEMDGEVYRLNIRKGEPGDAWHDREVVGKATAVIVPDREREPRRTVGGHMREFDVTAPATDSAREWQGWGTALKPGWEPCVVARKPLAGTVAENVQQHGTGAINVDGCRIPHGDDVNMEAVQRQQHAEGSVQFGAAGLIGSEIATYKPGGRWPANVAFDEQAAAMLDAQSGETSYNPPAMWRAPEQRSGEFLTGITNRAGTVRGGFGDKGGASRFFYTAKASRADRSTNGANNTHPTVKPTDLMRWLVRLVTPPGGVVLDPFAGSGTTLVAARAEGVRCIGIEREEEYAEIVAARLSQLSLFSEAS